MADESKTLADLEQDKPEDIVAELEQRAKPQTRPPLTVEEPEAEKPETTDEPDKDHPEEEAPKADQPPEEPKDDEPETEKEPEAPAILQRLTEEYGIKHTLKDEEALIKHYANLRRKLSERDDHAAIGRFVEQHGLTADQLTELAERSQGTQTTTKRDAPSGGGWSPPYEYDPAWNRTISRDEDGNYKGPADQVQKLKAYEEYVQAQMHQFTMDPVNTLESWLGPVIEQRVEQRLHQKTAEQSYQEFMQENGEFIEEYRDDIRGLMDNKGFSAVAAVEHLKLLHEYESAKTAISGKEAKDEDLKKLAARARKRGGAAATPIRRVKDLAAMPRSDAIKAIMAEKGETIPESW